MSDRQQSISEPQLYENKFVPDNFTDYFTDNTFIKASKMVLLLIGLIFFVGFKMHIKKITLLDLTTSDFLIFSMVGLGSWIINEGVILGKNIRMMEAFVVRDLQAKNRAIALLPTQQQINKKYRFIDWLLVCIFVVALFSPYLFPHKGIKAIATYVFVVELFIYAILRLRILCPYLTEFRSALLDAYNSDSGVSSRFICFNLKNIEIKAGVLSATFWGVCLLLRIDTPLMLFAYASSAGSLFFIGSGVYYYRGVFRAVTGEIDKIRMESNILK